MRIHTHLTGAFALSSSMIAYMGLYTPNKIGLAEIITPIVFVMGAEFGAKLPDIEKKGSRISNEHKFISFLFRLVFTHRGFIHSLPALFVLSLIIFPLLAIPYNIGQAIYFGIIVGYGSHLLLDALNPKGVPLLYPLKFRVSLPIFSKKTGSIWENVVFLGLLILSYNNVEKIISNIV